MKQKCLTLIPVVLVMIIIFRFSAQPGYQSDVSSFTIVDNVIEIYENIANKSIAKDTDTFITIKDMINVIVRKMAHISVYTVLSFFLCIHIMMHFIILSKVENNNTTTQCSRVNSWHNTLGWYKNIIPWYRGITPECKNIISRYNYVIPWKDKGRILIISSFISVLYAFSDEFHQRFVPGRSGNPLDVGIDSIGIFLGCVLYLILYKLILRFVVLIIDRR